MTRLFRSTALCALLSASPALADLTVDDAWVLWKAQLSAYGLTLDAGETRDGDALQIGEIRLSVRFPEEAGSAYVSFSGPRFAPLGDGTVEVRFPEITQFSIGGALEGEGSLDAAGEITGGATPSIMSGDPMKATSRWTSDRMTLKLTEVMVDGAPASEVDVSATLGTMTLVTTTALGDTHVTIDQTLENTGTVFRYSIAYGEGDQRSAINGEGESTGESVTSVAVLPRDGLDLLALHSQLRDGASVSLRTFTAQSRSSEETLLGGSVLARQTTSAEDYDVTLRIDETGADMRGSAGAFEVGGNVAGLPISILLNGESVVSQFTLPLLQSEAAQNAVFKLALNGLTLDEGLWSLVDPTAELPRDPMTIAFDIAAEARLLFEFLDIRAIMAGTEPPELPVTLDRVTLNGLTLAAVGAELTGTGDFTLDFSDMVTFDGAPAPDGQASFMLKGANGLIDRLIAIGLIGEDEAAGARMMLAMFAKPGEGEDVLSSQIEVKKTGEVLANGQRLR